MSPQPAPSSPLPSTPQVPAAAEPHGACHHHDHLHHHAHPLEAPGIPAQPAGLARRAAINTAWCLLGCSIGDVGVVVLGRCSLLGHVVPLIFALAIIAGLATSLAMETAWLWHGGQRLNTAFRQALGMSLLSMLAMELAMNAVDLGLTGGMRMSVAWSRYLAILAIGEICGFMAAFLYNLWRLQRTGQACH